MFETNERARLPQLLFVTDDTHRWAYISQTSNHEWFYVTHEYAHEEEVEVMCKQQFMIPQVPYLLGLTSADSPEAHVSEIQLVSPPWLNHQNGWQMEPLKRIRIIGNQYCYELESGSFYPKELSEHAAMAKVIWEKKVN